MKQSWHQNFKKVPKSKRTHADGTVFDSKGEMIRYHYLRNRELAGEIRNLQLQVKFPLVFSCGTKILTETGNVAVYTADFTYDEAKGLRPNYANNTIDGLWESVIEEYKGFLDPLSSFRIRVFEAAYNRKVRIIYK
jgi:hypothetical protein